MSKIGTFITLLTMKYNPPFYCKIEYTTDKIYTTYWYIDEEDFESVGGIRIGHDFNDSDVVGRFKLLKTKLKSDDVKITLLSEQEAAKIKLEHL